MEIGGEQEGIAGGEAPIARVHLAAVAKFGGGEIIPAEQLHHRQSARRIDADNHGVVELAISQAAFHGRAGFMRDVKIRQRVAFGRDEHS